MLPFGRLIFSVFCLVLYVPPVLFWGFTLLCVVHLKYILFRCRIFVGHFPFGVPFVFPCVCYFRFHCFLLMPLEGALSMRPPSAEDGGQAFSSSSHFCIYVRFRLQLPSAGVEALFRIYVLHLTSKPHMRGVCNRLLVGTRQWKRPRGVQRDPWNGGAQAPWLAQGLWLAWHFLVALRPLVAVRPSLKNHSYET